MNNDKPSLKPQTKKPLMDVKVIITTRNGVPALELRRVICNMDQIKEILSCAYHSTPITLMPSFPDRMEAINSMIKHGLVYEDEKETLRFTF